MWEQNVGGIVSCLKIYSWTKQISELPCVPSGSYELGFLGSSSLGTREAHNCGVLLFQPLQRRHDTRPAALLDEASDVERL